MDINIKTRIKLNNGVEMPILGFGTYMIRREKTVKDSITNALEAGYRLIDTAQMYDNEELIGEAIRESNIPRDEIFITTKLDNNQHGRIKAKQAFEQSMDRLGLEYIDLFLIHWPVEGLRLESWKTLVEIYNQNRVRAIGVSNYTMRHLKELFADSELKPAINQVEFNPFNYHENLLSFCNKEDIKIQAYTPLSRGNKFNDKTIRELSKKYSKSPAQIMMRWAIQHRVIPIPKSTHKNRIEENADIFDFTIEDGDMDKLDSLNENYRLAMDPHEIK